MFSQFQTLLEQEAADGRPLLVVLAGHNGAGKSTAFKKFLLPILGPAANDHIDPDDIEKQIRASLNESLSDDEFSKRAQSEANQMRENLLLNRDTLSFETVLSHPSKVDFMHRASQLGYCVVLVFIGLASPQLSWERVQIRVARGGHNVPREKIDGRYPRVLRNLALAIPRAHIVLVLDNSTDYASGDPYNAIALFHRGESIATTPTLPDWWQGVAGFL